MRHPITSPEVRMLALKAALAAERGANAIRADEFVFLHGVGVVHPMSPSATGLMMRLEPANQAVTAALMATEDTA